MSKKRKNKKCKMTLALTIEIALLWLAAFVLLFDIIRLNILPTKYIALVVAVVIGLNALITLAIILNKKTRVAGIVFGFLWIGISCFGIYYLENTYGFLTDILVKDQASANYQLVAIESYDSVKNLENKKIGVLNKEDEHYQESIAKLEKEIQFEKVAFDSVIALKDALLNKEIDAILIDETSHAILMENDEAYAAFAQSVKSYSVTYKVESIVKDKDVTKETFSILLTGIDTYGSTSTVSRSDVNIVITVNPNTGKIMLVHIPRDYFVTLNGIGQKDKLTHAGIYGIDCSVKTVEDLLGIDINYYVKVNFSSLVDIVDAIGGIDVNSKYAFTTTFTDELITESYTFKKGKNHLNGIQTLAFVRERHAFYQGDVARGENQMAAIEGIVNQCTDPQILGNYANLLAKLGNALETNMPQNDITSFIKLQIEESKNWSFESISLTGTNGSEYTYSYQSQKLYVMIPDESLVEAKLKVQELVKQ